uniref:Uncharacterized protein n=1 Tax=Candidatus Kentrum sp. FW TaxID=2126338 RepID=A0A450T486_9GAMM|nr:MAG: hypothetical protein BECKFW1821B_GA0114236_106515 [Candidatus Kentron sp. FW]
MLLIGFRFFYGALRGRMNPIPYASIFLFFENIFLPSLALVRAAAPGKISRKL